ncbi:hypothetical protein PSOL_02320 [Candidatus Phytoplasma solani]
MHAINPKLKVTDSEADNPNSSNKKNPKDKECEKPKINNYKKHKKS